MKLLRRNIRRAGYLNPIDAAAPLWLWRWPINLLMLPFLLLMPNHGANQSLATRNPYKVEAAYLRNFAHYVTWPDDVFPNSSAPWQIVVLGPDPFGDVLESTLQGRIEQGRSFEVSRAEKLKDLPSCQILYIAYRDAMRRRAVLSGLKDKPVLTVSDAPEFLSEGGVIQFEVNDRVRMSINLDQAHAISLTIQTPMLEVSSKVLENGVIRKVR